MQYQQTRPHIAFRLIVLILLFDILNGMMFACFHLIFYNQRSFQSGFDLNLVDTTLRLNWNISMDHRFDQSRLAQLF